MIEITDAEREAAVWAIQQLESYTWERVVDTAIAAINETRKT